MDNFRALRRGLRAGTVDVPRDLQRRAIEPPLERDPRFPAKPT